MINFIVLRFAQKMSEEAVRNVCEDKHGRGFPLNLGSTVSKNWNLKWD